MKKDICFNFEILGDGSKSMVNYKVFEKIIIKILSRFSNIKLNKKNKSPIICGSYQKNLIIDINVLLKKNSNIHQNIEKVQNEIVKYIKNFNSITPRSINIFIDGFYNK